MGRPIKKKFFANLLSPYQDHATGGPTGSGSGAGVASVTITTTGTNYTSIPGVTFSGPDTPTGTTATGVVSAMKAVSATVSGAGGTGGANASYDVGDVLTVVGGTATEAATFTVVRVKVRTVGVNDQGTGTWVTGDEFTFSSGFSVPAVISVTATAGAIDGYSIVNAGVRSTSASSAAVTPDSTTNPGGVQGVKFDLGMAVDTVTVDTEGSYSVLPSNPVATTTDSATGTGAALNLRYGVKQVGITDAGSGYTAAPSVTFSSGTAAGTAVLTAGGGSGLFVTAYIPVKDGGTAADGADIMKQEASRRYLVRNSDGQGQCKLVAKDNGNLLPGEMNLIATDHLGGTYYVTKLTARRARLVRITGTFYADNQVSGWTIDTATEGVVSVATA